MTDHSTPDLLEDLRNTISGEVRFDAMSRQLYSTDASIYQIEPVGVVIPRTAEDVIAVIETAGRYGVSVLPRGGGTSLAGQTVGHAVVIDFSKYMIEVLEVNAEERWVRTQPGVVLDELNRAAAGCGLMFGPDVATSTHATLGGMIGNNSAGAHSILYGRTVEHLEAVDLILADGSRLFLQRGAAQRDEHVRDLTLRVA